MGIQVNTSTVTGSGNDLSKARIDSASSNSAAGSDQLETAKGDTVSLSGVSSLIALGKATTLQDRQAKIDNLTTLVRAGQYQASATDVSRALVQDMMAE